MGECYVDLSVSYIFWLFSSNLVVILTEFNCIQVGRHKTDRTFGNASVPLLPYEADWLKELADVSTHFGGEQCPFVFQWRGQHVRRLNQMLRDAWKDAGMNGEIAFSLIRTSVSNQVRTQQSL